MKLAKIIPGKLLKSKKRRSVSRSEADQTSFSSQTTASSSSSCEDGFKKPNGLSTPTSVLPSLSTEITPDELPEISADLYLELKQTFEMIDGDGDGKIQREELVGLLRRLGAEPLSHEELKLMLDEVDRDGDGCISLLNVFRTIGDARCTLEDCRRMIGVVDRTGEGFVCFEDFSRMMEQQQR
jgi:calcium-binding protein CML